MKGIFLWDGKRAEDGGLFQIATVSMERLDKAGLWNLPTCTTGDGIKAIDLKIFIVRVGRIIGGEATIKNRVEIVRALSQYRYLKWGKE